MKRRILVKVLAPLVAGAAAATLALAGAPTAAAGSSSAPSTSASSASSACPGTAPNFTLTTAAQVPVLLVHGLNDSSALWTRGSPSMTKAISSALGSQVNIAYFDYSSVSTDWVNNPLIGPKLASCIAWLSSQSVSAHGPGKVIVVAHSMGGLAVRCAVDTACAGTGAASPGAIGLDLTLDTPNLGTFPGLVADGQWLCYSVPGCPGWLKLATTQAGRALDPNSASLMQLPLLPAAIPVHAFAGEITIRTSLFGIGPFSIASISAGDAGDIAVPVASALAEMPPCNPPDPVPADGYTCTTVNLHSGPGSGTTIENCGDIQTGQLSAWLATSSITRQLDLPCWHLTEVTNPVWQAGVIAAIKAYQVSIAGSASSCPKVGPGVPSSLAIAVAQQIGSSAECGYVVENLNADPQDPSWVTFDLNTTPGSLLQGGVGIAHEINGTWPVVFTGTAFVGCSPQVPALVRAAFRIHCPSSGSQ